MQDSLKSIAQASHNQHLETSRKLGAVEAANAAVVCQVEAGNVGHQIHLAVCRVDGQGSGAGPCGQLLDHVVGVGEVLADDGKAANAASVGGVDEAPVGVVADCIG